MAQPALLLLPIQREIPRDGWGLGGRNGVLWRYLHSGFGVCRITAVAGDGLTATADVVPRQDGEIELPAQVVGSTFATYKWAHYARTIQTATRVQLPITSRG